MVSELWVLATSDSLCHVFLETFKEVTPQKMQRVASKVETAILVLLKIRAFTVISLFGNSLGVYLKFKPFTWSQQTLCGSTANPQSHPRVQNWHVENTFSPYAPFY